MKKNVLGVLSRTLIAGTLSLAMLPVSGRGQGHAYGKEKHEHGDHDRDDDDDDPGGRRSYSAHDRHYLRGWYERQDGHLPPGLAKRDELPPGLEKQLEVRGTLPPGLRKKLQPCPLEFATQLPPPPPGYGDFLLGGHVLLMNRSNYMVLDIFHFER
jgi:hypothetical protein